MIQYKHGLTVAGLVIRPVQEAPARVGFPGDDPQEVPVSTERLPRTLGKHKREASPVTTASPAYCVLVAKDLGIKLSTARTAFINEPTQHVMGVVSWAMDKSDDPRERSKMILAWARKRGAGAFRSSPDEFVSLAGSVGKVGEANWRENEALA